MADLPEGFEIIAEGPPLESQQPALPEGFTVIAEGPPLPENQSFVPDWLKQLGSGMVEGTAGTVGMAGDAVQMMINPAIAFTRSGGPLAAMQQMTEAVQPIIAEDDGSYARIAGEYLGPDILIGGGLTNLGKMGLKGFARSLAPTMAGATGEYAGKKLAPDSPAIQTGLSMGGALTVAGVDSLLAKMLNPEPLQINKAANSIAENQLRNMVDADKTHAGLQNYIDNPPEGLEAFRSTAEVLDDPDWAKIEIDKASSHPNRVFAKNEARRDARDEIIETLLPEGAKSPSKEGAVIRSVVDAERQKLDDMVQIAYGTLDPDNTTRIPINRQKKSLDDLIKKRFGSGADKPYPALKELINDFKEAPDLHVAATSGDELTAKNFKTLDWLENMRRRAYDVADMLSVKRPKQAEVAERIAALTDAAQENAIKTGRGLTAIQRDQLVDARSLRRQLGETFQQKEMKKILGEGKYGEQLMDDSKVADAILKKGPEAIDRFKKAVGRDKKAMNTLRRAMLDRIQRDADGNITPNQFNKQFMRKYSEEIDRLFSPTHKKNLQRIADDLESQRGVAKKAFLSSEGSSPTEIRQKFAAKSEAVFDLALTMSMDSAGPAGVIIRRALKSQAKGGDEAMKEIKKYVDRKMLEAALDPKVAYDLTRPLPKEPGLAKRVLNRLFSAIFETPGNILVSQPGVTAATTQAEILKEPVMNNGSASD